MKKSLAKKLLIYFVLLNFLSITIVGIYAYTQAKEALISRTYDQLISVRIEKKKRVENFFQQCKHDMQIISSIEFPKSDKTKPDYSFDQNLTKKIIDHDFFRHEFTSLITNKQNFENIFIYQSDTSFIHSSIQNPIINNNTQTLTPQHKELFQSLLNKQSDSISVHELFASQKKFPPEILICKLIQQRKQKAVLAFQINSEIINAIMLDNNPLNGLGKSGEAYLVGKDNWLRSTSRFLEHSKLPVEASTRGVKLAFQDSTGTSIFKDYRGIKVLSSYSKLNLMGLEWVVLAEIDHQEAMVPIQNYGYNISYILIVLSLFLLGVVALIANTITAPIRKLRDETEKISSGIYEPVTDIKAEGEILELVEAFNHMTQTIKKQQENLKLAHDKSISSMIDGQESERNRLAKELHDGLAQTILAIKMRIENTAPENASIVLKESEEMFVSLMHEIRSMSNDLMPAVLREFGLVNALRGLLSQIEENSELKTVLIVDDQLPKLNKKTKTYLYRIAQEAVNNIIKHAQATQITINIHIKNDWYLFEICDNGIGLTDDFEYNQSNGISNILDRISVLGGKVLFCNNSPQGLKIQCEIPFKNCSNE
ncbi:histidine kinase [Marinifilum fragile]|uniref:sensor histidine kinase n=1 Tax=Marinifilum fragile TaxID=570161 RepID=UPI002AA71730|nr:histidine kinase [Marinifilum fragile]